ncbi:hypothetical protein [Ferrovum myxofaciens]|nr:hypothetical protein [Ferrovum myxofaciens]
MVGQAYLLTTDPHIEPILGIGDSPDFETMSALHKQPFDLWRKR